MLAKFKDVYVLLAKSLLIKMYALTTETGRVE